MTLLVEKIQEAEAARVRGPKFADAALLMVSKVARQGLRLIFMLAAARALGPGRFGVYILVMAVLEMAAVAGGSAFIDYVTRETAKDERLGWRVAVQLVLLRAGYAVPLAAVALGGLWLLGYTGAVLAAVAVMFATLVPRAVSECVQGALRGVCRYGSFLAVDVTVGLVLLAGGGWMLAKGGSLAFVVGTELAAAVAAALLALVLLAAFGKAQRAWLGWRRLVKKTLVFNFFPLATTLYDRIDIVLLSRLAGDVATGIYGMAYRVLSGLQLLPYGVFYSILPSVTGDSWGPAEKERLERAMGLLLTVGYVAVLGTVAFAGPVVGLLLGPRYAGSVVALEILIWSVIPRNVNFGLNIGLLATGNERAFTYTSSGCLVVNLIANVILIPLFSWRGAAAASIVTEMALLFLNCYWIRRAIGSVPVPSGALRNFTAFVCALTVMLVGRALLSPLLVGTVCLVSFAAYLCRTPSLAMFRGAWQGDANTSA